MRHIFIYLFVSSITLISAHAGEPNWIKVENENNGDTWYFDDQFTKKSDTFITVKFMKDLHVEQNGILSEVEIHEIDCKRPIFKIYHFDTYKEHMATGVKSGRTPDTPYTHVVVPGSKDYEAQTRYCQR